MATCILRVQDIPSNTIHLSGPVASPSVNSSYFSLSTSDDLDQMEHDFGLRHYIRESRPLPRKPGYPAAPYCVTASRRNEHDAPTPTPACLCANGSSKSEHEQRAELR